MKLLKNYFRDELRCLYEDRKNIPILFTGKYKHSDGELSTFTSIREYIPGIKTKTVCNHVNLIRRDIERYVKLTNSEHNRKFYFWAHITKYIHYGDNRHGLALAIRHSEPPIWIAQSGINYLLP